MRIASSDLVEVLVVLYLGELFAHYFRLFRYFFNVGFSHKGLQIGKDGSTAHDST